jgi:hypothetical protein
VPEDTAVAVDVRTEPRLGRALDEFERPVGAVVEVVVAQRVAVRSDGLVEVQRLLAPRDERDDARRGVVAGAEDERRPVASRLQEPRESPDALGVVVGVLDVGVVEETERHTRRDAGYGQNDFEAGR